MKIKNLSLKGFTLIELLVVVAIIGLLSSVVLASLNSVRWKASDARRVSDLKQISNALELYYSDNDSYPVGTYDSRPFSEGTEFDWEIFSGYLEPYLSPVPVDPSNGSQQGAMCGNCGEYYYRSVSGSNYSISTYLAVDGPLTMGTNQFGPYYTVFSNCTPSSFWSCN